MLLLLLLLEVLLLLLHIDRDSVLRPKLQRGANAIALALHLGSFVQLHTAV